MMGINLFQILNGLTFAALLFIVAIWFHADLRASAHRQPGARCALSARRLDRIFNSPGDRQFYSRRAGRYGRSGSAWCRARPRAAAFCSWRRIATSSLLTLGVAFILDDLGLVIWGGDTFSVPVPEALRGRMHIGNFFYPKYRIFVLLLGILVLRRAMASHE